MLCMYPPPVARTGKRFSILVMLVQEQLTALSQKQLDTANFPEQVVNHIEQDLAEVISRLDRQADRPTPQVAILRLCDCF